VIVEQRSYFVRPSKTGEFLRALTGSEVLLTPP